MNNTKIIKYYKFHSKIYDLTRWTFLFGRRKLINQLFNQLVNQINLSELNELSVLEVGCGTGYLLNLIRNKNKEVKLFGIDLSDKMLAKAKKKSLNANLLNSEYSNNSYTENQFDVIILSYAFTIMANHNEAYFQVLENIKKHLKPNGIIAVVDFCKSNNNLYHKFMLRSNVKIDSNLKNILEVNFKTISSKSYKSLYLLWDYFCFIGKNIK